METRVKKGKAVKLGSNKLRYVSCLCTREAVGEILILPNVVQTKDPKRTVVYYWQQQNISGRVDEKNEGNPQHTARNLKEM